MKRIVKKSHFLGIIMAGSAVVLTGCEHPSGQANNTGTGALMGAGVGTAVGAGAGGGRGAVMGGLLGAVAGGLVGGQMDRNQADRLRREAPATYERVAEGRSLTVSDVQALVKAGVSDDVIIAQIQNTRTVYQLSANDIIALRNGGASDRVVNYMVGTAGTPVSPSAPPAQFVQSDFPPVSPAEQPPGVAPAQGYVWEYGEWQWTSDGWVWMGGRWTYPPWPGAVWAPGSWSRGPSGQWRHTPGQWR